MKERFFLVCFREIIFVGNFSKILIKRLILFMIFL